MKYNTFEIWMAAVDSAVSSILYGMTSGDLPDICYMDLFEDGVSPRSAARQAIKSAGGSEGGK
jgi:hypothetical protein